MNLPVLTTPEAESQIREIDDWWRTNRPASPDLFAEELAASFDLIAREPHIGRSYRHPAVRGTRRILLRAARYHIYYVARTDAAIVIAVWHARRGNGPPLRGSPV